MGGALGNALPSLPSLPSPIVNPLENVGNALGNVFPSPIVNPLRNVPDALESVPVIGTVLRNGRKASI